MTLDDLLGLLKAGEVPFGKELALRHPSTYAFLAVRVAEAMSEEDDQASPHKLVEVILTTAMRENGREPMAGKWPVAAQEKVVRLINAVLPSLMYEFLSDDQREGAIHVPNAIKRQAGRNELHRVLLDDMIEELPEISQMALDYASDPSTFSAEYDHFWGVIDEVQAKFDAGSISPDEYNSFMGAMQLFTTLIERLNAFFCLPHGEERFPPVLKAVIRTMMSGCVAKLREDAAAS